MTNVSIRTAARQVPRQVPLTIALLLIGLGNLVIPAILTEALPVDYLIVALAICGIAIIYRLRLIVTRVRAWWVSGLFVLLCVPGFIGQSLTGYTATKALALIIVLLLALAAAQIRDPSTFMPRLMWTALTIGSAFSALALQFGGRDVGGRLVFLGLNPIGIGRVAGLVIVVALTLVLTRRVTSLPATLILAGLTGLGGVVVIASGSRGPLVAAAVGLVALLALLATTRRISVRTTFLIALGTTAAAAGVLLSDSSGLTRILNASDSGRSALYEESLALAIARPAGIGWGQLGQYIVDFRAINEEGLYAHNVFLEIFVEGGVVALVAFLLLVWASTSGAWRAARRHDSFTTSFVVLIYALASAQFSSDIVGNRLMWLMLALSLISGWWVKYGSPVDGDVDERAEHVMGGDRVNPRRSRSTP